MAKMRRIKMKKILSIMMIIIILLIVKRIVFAEEKDIEKTKAEILQNIETLQTGLFKTKECLIEAKTEEEILRCKETLKIRKFEEVQDMLFEMGMSREERKMRLSPRQY
jgi:hypothetical protein